ncbi:hypothetical protein ACFDTO_23345 [Microbacteriaceae bacterium 4G12]
MVNMLRYQYKSNSRVLLGFLLVFAILQTLFLLNVNVFRVFPLTLDQQEVASWSLAVATFAFLTFLLFIQAMVAFNRMISNPLLRLTPVSGVMYVSAHLLFWTLVAVVFSVVGFAFQYLFYIFSPHQSVIAEMFQRTEFYLPEGLIAFVYFLVGVYGTAIELFFIITLTKALFKKARGIIGIILFFILTSAMGWMDSKLQNILPGEGFFTVYGLHLGSMIFTIICTILLLWGTVYLIEKRIEN